MDSIRRIAPFVIAMAVIVTASNFLVQIPFDHFGMKEVLTWGAFTYPVAFLINDLTNRRFGVRSARLVIYAGFALAVLLSIYLATPRIAIASGTAFLMAQLLDAQIFDRLRGGLWWRAPFVSTLLGSALDTVLFFALAFSAQFAFLDAITGNADGSLAFPVTLLGAEMPLWASLAIGDFCVKILTGLAMLIPYAVAMRFVTPAATIVTKT